MAVQMFMQPCTVLRTHQTRQAGCSMHCASIRPVHRVPTAQNRLLRRDRSGLRCWATIPVPDSTPIISDLGWPVDFAQHYVKGKLIGQGSFGSVYLGIDLHTGREVAVKVMPKQRGKLTKERTLQKLAKEVGILTKMQNCKNTVRLLGCFESNDEVMVVTQICSGGDLQKLSDAVAAGLWWATQDGILKLATMGQQLEDHGPAGLPERAVALIAWEVLQVIDECHHQGILHGDIKPANFVLANRTKNPLVSNDINLLFGDPWLLAIDFGCSQYLGSQRFSKRTGTPVYMAPEIFERDYHWEADMWSLGIMLYQLYARRFPFWKRYEDCRTAKLEEVAVLVAEAPILMDYGPWLNMSAQGIDFLQRCLQRDYTQRITSQQAQQHPWMQQWLPLDDAALGMSLDSLGTSSEDEELALYQQQQQQRHQQQQYQQQHLYEQQTRQQLQQQKVLVLPGQQQHQAVLTPQQIQQQLAAGTFDPNHMPAPGAYSSSSSTGGTSPVPKASHLQQQQQHQQVHGSIPLPPQQPQQQHDQPSSDGGAVTNNIVPGSSRQQQQQQGGPVEVNAATGASSRPGKQ